MKTATLKQIKTDLSLLDTEKMADIIIRLSKYKKENKELLTYLLFESDSEDHYISEVKKVIDEDFSKLNSYSSYLAKKTIRKALRTTNKFIKYSGKKTTEIELLMYFLLKLKTSSLNIRYNLVLNNMYVRQLEKINKAMGKIHEDLQFDYKYEIEDLLLETS